MFGELAPIAWQVGGIFGIVILFLAGAWFVHIRDCSKFRKEVRDGMADIKDEMREDMGEVKADIKVVEAIVKRIENGKGS